MIDRTVNLLPRLLPTGLGHHELISALSPHFGSSVHDTERRATLFPMRPPYALRLEYNRELELTGAFAEERLTEQDIETVHEQLSHNYFESAGAGVGQAILFASGPVEGWWVYREKFRIVPVPPDAPRAPFLLAAHPFLLEFAYDRSPDFMVSMMRRHREQHRIALLLSSLLRGSITWYFAKSIGNSSHVWVQLPDPAPNWNVAYCQIAYEHASILRAVESFTPIDGLDAIPEVPAESYYRPGYIHGLDELELPDDLAESFDLFGALPAERQDRFLQASYWLNQTTRVNSFSSIFMHTIQAIESLAWQRRSQNHCPRCNKPEGPGPTRLFNEFLDRFAPDAIEGRHTLYSVRSGLTHGSMPPFLVDTEMYFGLVPEDNRQRDLVSKALEAARIAMHNWLRDPI